jgi:hypothetical protein
VLRPAPPPRPVAPTSFDRDAARQAWRQVARTRGAGPGIGVDRPGARGWTIWLGALVIVGVAAWAWYPRPEPATETPAAAGVATAATTEGRSPARAEVREDAPRPSVVAAVAAGPRDETTSSAGSAEVAGGPPLRPRLQQTLDRREVPVGTERTKAENFRALPKGRGDGDPLGGIGAEALHVDQLSVGSRLRGGSCEGEPSHFREGQHDEVHACIRVVHRRIAQQILVRWERDGRLVRRQWLPVPSTHAYRTRASLPVKRRFSGDWTVRVFSLDGVELATKKFRIDAPRRSRSAR